MDTSKLSTSLKVPFVLEILPSAHASNYLQLEVEKRCPPPIAHPTDHSLAVPADSQNACSGF